MYVCMYVNINLYEAYITKVCNVLECDKSLAGHGSRSLQQLFCQWLTSQKTLGDNMVESILQYHINPVYI